MSSFGGPEPLKVAPLIKLSRWTLLISGIFYGVNKLAFYRSYDKPLKVLRKKQIAEEAIVRKKQSIRDLADVLITLGEIGGMKFEPDWLPDFLK